VDQQSKSGVRRPKKTKSKTMKTTLFLLTCLIGLAVPMVGLAQPIITRQPADFSVSLGATVTHQVIASGTGASREYQWRLNELVLMNATNRTLVLTNVQLTHAGGYSVVVSDTTGSVTSRVATLTVDPTFTKITAGDPVNEAVEFYGCDWIDYDNDGFPDLFVNTRAATHNYLYRNNRDGSFSKITTGAIVTDAGESLFSTWGDFDNDGFLDAVVGRNPGVLFYHNNGDGTFSKVANLFPGTGGAKVFGLACADYDRDGLLDVFVPDQNGNNLLYHNNGDGTFARIIGQRIISDGGSSINPIWGDYDNDGWPDLFVSNYFNQRAFLYRNAANGSFDKILTGPVVAKIGNWTQGAWGDYNNDGLLDLFVSAGGHLATERNSLYQNNGDATFTAITTGPLVTEARQFHGCAWGDYDNDGFLDLFVLNIATAGNNFLYHNNGDGGFEKIVGGSLVNESGFSNGCAWGDYDNDGFLDLFVANGGIDGRQKNFLYRNNGNGNAWMKVRCVGTVSNRSAIGAKVRVRATIGGKTLWQLREISNGSGLIAHFGLGNATNIEVMRIEWPSGIVQEFHDVAPKQFLTLTEPARLQSLRAGGLRIQSWKGMAFEVQASTNLDQWSPLTTVTNLTGTLEFTDPNAANDSRRFYRTVQTR
jgi:enediyne biosynthesis protein E4